MKIGFIGGGTMAEAILGGMLDAGVAAAGDVLIGEPVAARRDYLSERYDVGVSGSNHAVLTDAEIVLLAVKPQDLPKVYAELSGRFTPKQAVLSIVAGAPDGIFGKRTKPSAHHQGYAQYTGANRLGYDDVGLQREARQPKATGCRSIHPVHYRRRRLCGR